MRLLHVLQHTSAEYLGLIEDHLEGRNLRFRYHRPFTGKTAWPEAAAITDGLVLLGGGPWGSAGTRDVPSLAAEVALTKSCLERHVPVIGIGLGAQILAIAEGGGSSSAPLTLAVLPARRTAPHALHGYLPETFPVAIYMRDWPEPPAQATVLARADDGRALLWQTRETAFGFAGHPGFKVGMVEDLVMEFAESPDDLDAGIAALRRAQRGIEDALVPIMTGLVQATGWMENGDAPGP